MTNRVRIDEFTVYINLDADAMHVAEHIADALERIAKNLRTGTMAGQIYSNGKVVGWFGPGATEK